MVVVIKQVYTVVKTWQFRHLKFINLIVYKLYLNKDDLRKLKNNKRKVEEASQQYDRKQRRESWSWDPNLRELYGTYQELNFIS